MNSAMASDATADMIETSRDCHAPINSSIHHITPHAAAIVNFAEFKPPSSRRWPVAAFSLPDVSSRDEEVGYASRDGPTTRIPREQIWRGREGDMGEEVRKRELESATSLNPKLSRNRDCETKAIKASIPGKKENPSCHFGTRLGQAIPHCVD